MRLGLAIVVVLAGSLLLAACASPHAGGTPNPTPSAAYGPSNTGGPTATAGQGGIASSGAPAAPLADACALVTETEVTAALGVDPGAGTNVLRDGVTSECQFGDTPKFVQVDLGVGDAKTIYDQGRANLPAGATAIDLDGIGDKAFGAFMNPAAVIGFYRGDSFVAITIYDDGSQSHAVTLAKAAAARL